MIKSLNLGVSLLFMAASVALADNNLPSASPTPHDSPEKLDWHEAEKYCATLERNNYRLPTSDELLTLLQDEGVESPLSQGEMYWSSGLISAVYAESVKIGEPMVYFSYTDSRLAVRCVKDPAP